jgi:hypothetical protein
VGSIGAIVASVLLEAEGLPRPSDSHYYTRLLRALVDLSVEERSLEVYSSGHAHKRERERSLT